MALTVPLRLKDETDQVYLDRNPKGRYKAMEETLEKFKDLDPKGRYLLLHGSQLADLENRLKTTVGTPDELLGWVDRLTKVGVGGVDIPLSDFQLQQLKDRAAYWEVPAEEYIRQELIKAVGFMCTGRYEVTRG